MRTGRTLAGRLVVAIGLAVTTGSAALSMSGSRVVAEAESAFPTSDGQSAALGLRLAGSVTELVIAGRAGVALDASAVVLSVTAIGASGPGFVTVYPCAAGRPNASHLNYSPASTVASAVVATLDSNGKVCIFTSADTHLFADINGWFPADSDYRPTVPSRLLDTRPGSQTIDGQSAGFGGLLAGSVTELVVAGRASVDADVGAVVLSVTATGATGPGYVTVFPCAQGRPNASNLNFSAGAVIATSVVSQVDENGRVCLFTSGSTHLVADVNGWFPSSSTYEASPPARLVDSRPATATVDGAGMGAGLRLAGSVTEVAVAGRGGVQLGASAAVLNVTVTGANGSGFITVYPCNEGRPVASNLNFTTASVVAAAVVAKLDPTGNVCLFTSGTTHVVVDVSGWFPPDGGYSPIQPQRLLDSRQQGANVIEIPGLPAQSGVGRRVVYSKSVMRIWKVETDGSVVDTYRVSGREGQPKPGTYSVFSKSLRTCARAHPDICMRFMVRFAHSLSGDNIGFHEIPARNGVPLQAEDQLGMALSGGCVRQATIDAIRMFDWADIGTTVVVTD